MDSSRQTRVHQAFDDFFAASAPQSESWVLDLFLRTAETVPAYRKLLRENDIDPAAITTFDDFQRLPLLDKPSYHERYPLPELCRDGALASCDMIAVSSGSSGRPTIWPRTLEDELHVARRFEQVLVDGFHADSRTTLAVVCFPLGTWVGGLFTQACVRHLAAKGCPITVVAPGNNKAEILRVLPELAPHFEQVVLLGYPPFVKDVIDTPGVDWPAYRIKLVLAGEVFSEQWRDLVSRRAGVADPLSDIASLYGTADSGVLGNETALSVGVRRFFALRPDLAREVFGDSRLPTLVQYDPASRFFEVHDGTLVFTADGGIPLIRYRIADEGGILGYDELMEFCAGHGFTPPPGPELPFVFLFGRSLFTVSFFGANVYPENVTVGLEQPGISDTVTGKFVIESVEDADRDRSLRITVETAPGQTADAAVIAASIRDELLRLNSEFAHYVPAERQLPEVVLRPSGDPEYFPAGVKHRYTRRP
ncbi:phenylacetate--CoA ligase family protein [Lentzea sp. BCCO 10_0856]|uniref:Phenylacetate--CoA ligase family protein n=1 Tax=Lentzea miocenica TaxID=3095431 RepID=A0ABU4SXC0_9PSEU|nr:phenylacetate--CoA ligase family protein [Lentzea sp. BCCO 10_0856]MDX8030546.1 phenylacetate--CoA ligase family protein [Lentzea sp. BCCO 10_0856]